MRNALLFALLTTAAFGSLGSGCPPNDKEPTVNGSGGSNGSGGTCGKHDAAPPVMDAQPPKLDAVVSGCVQPNFAITADNGCASSTYVTATPASIASDGLIVKDSSSSQIYMVVTEGGIYCIPITPQVALEWKDSCTVPSCLDTVPPSANGCVGVTQVSNLASYCAIFSGIEVPPRAGVSVLVWTDASGVVHKYVYAGCNPSSLKMSLSELIPPTLENAIFPGGAASRELVIPSAAFAASYEIGTPPTITDASQYNASAWCSLEMNPTLQIFCVVPH